MAWISQSTEEHPDEEVPLHKPLHNPQPSLLKEAVDGKMLKPFQKMEPGIIKWKMC